MDDWYDRPLEVWRPRTADDGQGGVIETFEQVGVPLGGKVDQPSASEKSKGGATLTTLAYSIYFDGVVDVQRGDELRDPVTVVDGQVFEVTSVVRPSVPVYTKALCRLDQVEEDTAADDEETP